MNACRICHAPLVDRICDAVRRTGIHAYDYYGDAGMCDATDCILRADWQAEISGPRFCATHATDEPTSVKVSFRDGRPSVSGVLLSVVGTTQIAIRTDAGATVGIATSIIGSLSAA